MIEQVCAFIHNYFVYSRYSGTFTITNGSIDLPFLVIGQYFRICGSHLNDGVYQYPATWLLKDETFEGVIWEMRVPNDFLHVVKEIENWVDKYGEIMRNPFRSENVIGVYSYEKMTSGKTSGENISTWQDVFKSQLNQWRKLA